MRKAAFDKPEPEWVHEMEQPGAAVRVPPVFRKDVEVRDFGRVKGAGGVCAGIVVEYG